VKSLNFHPFRTRFAKDIVAEILLPEHQTGKIALIASGLPSPPVKKEFLRFLASHGYVAIFPRYRGTWESSGLFLRESPANDIADILSEIAKRKNFTDIFSGQLIILKVSSVHLFGSSFGGPAVLLNSKHPLVKKVITLAPVTNWRMEGELESFQDHVRLTESAFGMAFRPESPRDWQKLVKTDFYNPIDHIDKIDGHKVFIIHAKDDATVPYITSVDFAQKTQAAIYLKPTGGHNIRMTHGFLWKKIEAFLRKK